ncbi:MAG: nucleoside deaminase [Chloracidobacterium sp.]|nr:nucleoside deaminase [Chloracidobacterium sp.]MBK7804656.1 nucleoside deaminase [Chloracidobacterium sp.]MBL0240576.1 nucleoside deaminase [Chloracidobacterium sp.]MBP9934638.1 tRNA adenosine(34) deaminase TadA [Pyrinomonadaceae bacterium]
MMLALDAARAAQDIGEVPIGACIISNTGELLSSGFNRTITDCDPTAHAEIVALRAAATVVENYRLTGVTLYTTLEPCAMCAGALVTSRVKRVVYGANDERFGAIDTHFGIGKGSELNHRIEFTCGVLADECRELLRSFFRSRRK